MTFGNLGLRTKIILSGCLPLALLVFLTVVATLSVNSLLNSVHWVDHTHTVIGEAMKIEAAAVDMETGMRGYLLAGKETFLEPYNQGNKTFHDLIGKLKRTVDDNPPQVKLLNETEQTIDNWEKNIVEPMIAFRKKVGNGKTMDDIADLVGEARGKAYFDKFRGQMKTFKEREEKLMGIRQAKAMDTAGSTKNILLFGTIITMLAAAVLSWFMGRAIVKPLSGIIYGLNDGSDQMAASSSQLASSSQQMSMGASDQAASIEETSSSLEEMASMTKQNADNSKQADNLMAETNKTVGHANKSMGDLTVSMEEISKASEETSKIIKTIDEIAFQTNLLALNAAVEAARAGDAGAGFAVVADEVRNLAMRAADAAKNTANLIEGTVKKVSDGTEIVTVTNEAFKEVAENSGKVGALVAEISAASVEQAQGIEQINKAIAQMDQVVQKNSATAEENASSSEEMSSQAEQMKAYVSELSAMVGGSNNAAATGRPAAASQHARSVVTADTAQSASREVVPVKAREVTPEQVIPMDGDDFTNF